MVIGNGMIAKRFAAYTGNDQFVIFASGVSNSRTNDNASYQREAALLLDTIRHNKDKTLVYFSTCSIYDPGEKDSPYVLHKLKMEKIIAENCSNYRIFRVSNLVGHSENPNTVLNFFIYHMRHRVNFDLWTNASRNLLDIDDLFEITDIILRENFFPGQVINVASPVNYKVPEIIKELEAWQGRVANYVPITKGHNFNIDISLIEPVISRLGLKFDKGYLRFLLKKYYQH